MKDRFLNQLDSWFGETPYDILQENLQTVDGDPILFATVRSGSEMLAVRVRKIGGKIKVNTLSKVSCP